MRALRFGSVPAWTCVALLGVASLGHRWIALGWNASRYPTASPSARTQIVVAGGRAYVAAAAAGIEIVDARAAKRVVVLPPIAPADRVDDLAVADGVLFALDATPPGHLVSYRLVESGIPRFTGSVVAVPVGPFSGVAAAAGVVIVSGGTSRLTAREYDVDGRLALGAATADYGRGQPDVSLRADGRLAAISTHVVGPAFAMTIAEVVRRPLALRELGRVELQEGGFTPGGFKPARFPIASAWRGDRLYVADGGGLAVLDVADPAHPRELRRDRTSRPAVDVVVSGDELDVSRGGRHPAVVRYRLDGAGLPAPVAAWSTPESSLIAGIGRRGDDLLISSFERGWRLVPRGELLPIP
jgi:hypothetical protein